MDAVSVPLEEDFALALAFPELHGITADASLEDETKGVAKGRGRALNVTVRCAASLSKNARTWPSSEGDSRSSSLPHARASERTVQYG